MNNRKTMIRFFTIADYEEEERWLREKHKAGWKLVKTVIPCFYIFEKCTPEDVVYRLDYKNGTESDDYFQIFQDYGWEYFNSCMGWLYFRKPASETDADSENEIFSDDCSRIDMVNHIVKTRMLPLLVIFLCIILPNFARSTESRALAGNIFLAIFTVLILLYIVLFAYCGTKLRKLRKKYGEKR